MPEVVRLNPCRHLFTDGRQCGSPALRGEPLCYHHHTARQPIPSRSSEDQTTPQLPAPGDFYAIQLGIGEVLRLLVNEEINDRRAASLFRGLATASQNLARAHREDKANRDAPQPSLPVTDLVNHPSLGSLALPPTTNEYTEVQDASPLSHPIPTQQNEELSPSRENNPANPTPGAPSLTVLSLRVASPGPDPTPEPQDLPPVPTPSLLFTPQPTMSLADELRFGELYTRLEASFLEKTRRFEEEKTRELEQRYEDRYDELMERNAQQRAQLQAQQRPELQLAS